MEKPAKHPKHDSPLIVAMATLGSSQLLMVVMETEKPTATMASGQQCRHHRLWDSKQTSVPRGPRAEGHGTRLAACPCHQLAESGPPNIPDTRQAERTAQKRTGPQRRSHIRASIGSETRWGWPAPHPPRDEAQDPRCSTAWTLRPPLSRGADSVQGLSTQDWKPPLSLGPLSQAGDSGAKGSSAPLSGHTCAPETTGHVWGGPTGS